MGKRKLLRRLLVRNTVDRQRAAARAECNDQCSFSAATRASSTIPAAYMLFALFFSETRMVRRNFHVSNPVP